VDTFVSKIQNTELKGPTISQNIPTVAQQTQGHVVKFAANATQRMGADGLNVRRDVSGRPFSARLSRARTGSAGRSRSHSELRCNTVSLHPHDVRHHSSRSVVLLAHLRGGRFLFCGDANAQANAERRSA
jgi:hypothetical protein